MRTSLKQAVGLVGDVVDPITAAYDAILATEPTVPLLFRLTQYRGQQVLWQNAACTVPVASIGDPVGGVRHPVTGAILAVQTTDAARPIWGGESVGAVFDGTGSYMLIPLGVISNGLYSSLVDGGGSVIAVASFSDDTSSRSLAGIASNSLDLSFFELNRIVSADTYQVRRRDSAGFGGGTRRSADLIPRLEEPCAILSQSMDDGETRNVNDEGVSDSYIVSIREESPDAEIGTSFAIGALNRIDQPPFRFFDRSVSALLFYGRIVQDVEFLSVSKGML